MTQARSAARYILFALAIAWPLDLLQYIPIVNLSVVAVFTGLLGVLLVVDLSAGRKFRVPFEVIFPVALIAAILAFTTYTTETPAPFEAVGAVLLLIVTIHFAQSSAGVERWLQASVVAGCAVCLTTLIGYQLGHLPTAFSLHHPATLTFAYDLAGGLHILALCAVAAIYFATHAAANPAFRTCATGAAFLLVVTLVGKVIRIAATESLPRGPSLWELPPPTLAALALVLWLMVRILAKLEIRRRQSGDRLPWLFLGMAAVTVVYFAAGPLQPRLYHGYLLGLACGYALPERENTDASPWPKIATAVLLALLVTNLFVVFSSHHTDPRNYEIATQEDFRQGDHAALLSRLDLIERHRPEERRSKLWRARVALANDEPNGAAMAFGSSLKPEFGRFVLAPPSAADNAEFVVQLRDYTSTLAEDRAVCAYERALLATGERDAAMYSLRLLTGITLARAENVSPETLAEAASFVVGDASVHEDFAAWSTDELLTLFAQWGAEIGNAPETLPAELLPAILVVQRRLDRLEAFVALGNSRYSFQVPFVAPIVAVDSDANSPPQIDWSSLSRNEAGAHTATVQLSSGDDHALLGALEMPNNGGVRFRWEVEENVIVPFTPGVRILLPPPDAFSSISAGV